jgi:peptide/nickel transport system substrate-binding protein
MIASARPNPTSKNWSGGKLSMTLGPRRRRWHGLFLVAALVVLSSCQATSSPDASGPDGGDSDAWRVILSQDFASLDPVNVYDSIGNIVIAYIMDPLVQLELVGDTLEPVGHVAESWEAIDGGFRLHLRQDVQFHDGSALTMDDVMYSLEAYQDPASARSSITGPFNSVEAIDDQTLEIGTDAGEIDLMIALSDALIVPQGHHEADPAAFGREPIGSGAYRVAEWVPGQEITLEANEDYWRGAPSPSTLRVRGIADSATRAAELLAGSADIITNVGVQEIPTIEEGDDAELVPIKAARTIYFPFNITEAPFDDVRVRQAVNHAIDRESIVSDVLGGYGVVLTGIFGPGWRGHDPDLEPYAYDPDRARELLAEAGYPDGFETDWHVTQGNFLKDSEIAAAVANQLGQVGIVVNLQPTESATLIEEVTTAAFPGITSGSWGQGAESAPMVGYMYGPDRAMHQPELWELVESALASSSEEERVAIFQEANQLAHDEAIWMFVHVQDELYAKRAGLDWEPRFMTGSRSQPFFYNFSD